MGKVKESKGAKAANPLAAVKNGGITKPSQTPKAKAKVAAQVTAKAIKNKKLKVDSDVSSDESEDEIESGSDSEADSDSSDGSSASGDEGDSEEETKGVKLAKPATNGKVNGPSHADSDDSESDSDDEAKPKANGAKTNGAAAADSDSSDSSDSSGDEVEKKKEKKKAAVNGKSKKDADSSGDDDEESADSEDDSDESGGSDGSESDSDAESESPKTPAKPQQEEAPKKRKFEAADDDAFPKKAKMDNFGDESSTIFVGRLSWGVDDDMLFEAFKEFDGLLSARVVTHKDTGRSRGFGYVDFSAHAAAKTALDAMQGQEIDGRPINLDLAKGRSNTNTDSPQSRAQDRAKRHGDVVSPPSDTLFVGNIPFEATQEDIHEFFSDTAEVVSVRLPTDPETGRPKGFGYVSFNSVEDAQRVFQAKNGASIGPGRAGRVVRLDYASQRPPREGNFGGGRGGGRGGFRGGRGDARGGRGGRGGGRGSFGGGRGGFRIPNDGGAPTSNRIKFDD